MEEEDHSRKSKKSGMKSEKKLVKNRYFSKNGFFFILFYAIISKKLM